MKGFLAFFKKRWVIQLIGIIALSLLIWFFGDLVAIADRVPLRSELARLFAILMIVFLWGLNNIRLQWTANRNNQELLDELAERPDESTYAPDASEEEIGILTKDFDEALSILKKSKHGGKSNKQYVYELPWYIIIGPPGSGKTTALINSGLKFPLSHRFGDSAIRGVGGTRNCDWWFTEDAVLLDTAGRYTTQDSHQAVDQAAWRGFLELIKKHRPRRPINGVFVTMSISDLIHQSEEERNQHAQAIRQRILELNDTLGIRYPIYMLFTKCDLIAGFTEFFDDLDHDSRRQVWGETFPETSQQADKDVIRLFFDHFDHLIERLNDRLLKRIQDERDMQRRSRIFIFPQQVALLKELMRHFLDAAFAHNRYESPVLLRGVYFTSGTQEGTPIDRLMSIMAKSFQLDRQKLPVYSGQGRGYFINRLMKDIVFQESGLTGVDQRIEKRRLWLQRISYATAIGLTVAVIGLWAMSYAANQGAIMEMKKAITEYDVAVAAKPDWEKDLKSLLPRMNAADQARKVFAGEAPLLMGFGLYQGDKLQPQARRAYHRLLDGALTPLIQRRLEQRIKRRKTLNHDVVYQLLRVYLMMADRDRFQAGTVVPWIRLDWHKTYANEPAVIAELDRHLDAWAALPPAPSRLNQGLIDQTRAELTKIPVADQVYARIKGDAQTRNEFDFVALRAMGRFGDRVFASRRGQLNQLMIPGLYTYQGFHQIFLVESLELAKEQIEQDWVLGGNNRPDPEEAARLQKDLQRLYFRDYAQHWENLLSEIRVKKFNNVTHALDVLEYASDVDSPVRHLLAAVESNTSLTKSSTDTAALLANVKKSTAISGRTRKLLELEGSVEAAKPYQMEKPGMDVERHFKRINIYSQGESPLINKTLGNVADLHNFMAEIGSLSGGEAALKTANARLVGGGGDIIGRIRLDSNRSPEPLKRWLRSFATNSWAVVLNGAREKLNEYWRSDVLPHYNAGLDNRYPLFRDSRSEATLNDFSQFFSKDGVLDRFFKSHLAPFVDTSKGEWRNKQLEQQSIGISSTTLKQFQYADKIRRVYFRNGASTPTVNFNLKPAYLDADVAKFTLMLDGQSNVYRHGPTISKSLQWPGPAAGRVRLVFESLNGAFSSQLEEGPWAWFRTLDKTTIENTNGADRFMISFNVDNHKARYVLEATSVVNPFKLAELERFRCPRKL